MANGIAIALIVVAVVIVVGLIVMESMKKRGSGGNTIFVIPEWIPSWRPSWRPWLGPGGERRYFPDGPNLGPGGQHRDYPPAPNPTPNPAPIPPPAPNPTPEPSLGPGGERRRNVNPFPHRPNVNPFPPVGKLGFTGSQEPALLGKGSEEGFENFAAF
jgi:hypothetical protein